MIKPSDRVLWSAFYVVGYGVGFGMIAYGVVLWALGR